MGNISVADSRLLYVSVLVWIQSVSLPGLKDMVVDTVSFYVMIPCWNDDGCERSVR